MKKVTAIVLVGLPLGTFMYFLLRRGRQTARETQVHLEGRDLQYQDLSPSDLASQNLTDINEANAAELKELGLDEQSLERLIDNRPYRNKLDLVSRMVLTEEMYAKVKDKIGVANGREPVKVAS